jgi:hypothetical protein
MSRYPVVRHRELRPFFRWSALRQRLRPLKAGPAQILVYETDTRYVTDVDPGRAVAVSLVDMRLDMPVTLRRVRRGVDVRVTGYFNCWVTDPVEVVHAHPTMRGIRRLLRESLVAVPGFVYSDYEALRERLSTRFRNTEVATSIPGLHIAQAGMRIYQPRLSEFYDRMCAAEDDDYTEA